MTFEKVVTEIYGVDLPGAPRFCSGMPRGSDQKGRPALYFVCPVGERWMVSHSGAEYPYQARHIAIEAAVDAANTSGKRGHDAQVLERSGIDDWQPIWTYGSDLYPWTGE